MLGAALAWRKEAVRSFDRAIRVNPVDPELHFAFVGMGYALIELGRFDEAIVAGKSAIRQNPPFPRLTAVSRPLSPISDVAPRRVRRLRMCLSSIPHLQSLRGSLAAGNQTRSC